MKSFLPKSQLVHCTTLKMLVLSTVLWSLLSFTSYGLNPGKIEGMVSDGESYATIPAVKVELLKVPDSTVVKTVITNNDGKYLIEDVPFGQYLLRISGMTYQKQIVPDVNITPEKPAIKFGTTNLLPESKMLKEVGIFGYKLTGQMEDDKTIYTIKPKSADIAQSGLDLLRQLPDLNVDFRTNEVTMAGNNIILFQVNGKKVDKSYLMQLNPKLIDKVEIITNPGVKYDADVDAVINFILKKDMAYGLSGRVSVEIPTSKTFFSNNNFSVDYFTKGMRFFVSGWGGGSKWDIEMDNVRNNLADNSTYSQGIRGTNKNRYGGFNYGMDWFINDHNIFNFYSSVNPKIPTNDDFKSDDRFVLDTVDNHYLATSSKTDKNLYNDYSLFYKHKFAKKDHEFSLETYYSNNATYSNELYYEQQFDANNELSNTFNNERNQITDNTKQQLNLKADYTYPFTEKLKLSVGYNSTFNRIRDSYQINSDEISKKLNYDEDRYSGYSNIAWSPGNFNLQSGLRFESSFVNITDTTKSNGNYHCFLPFASVQYKLGKSQTFRLNYRRSINRPGMSQVSPFGYREDAYTVEVGNPNLSPAYINKIEFTHRIQLKGPMYISYRPYLSFINNGIRQVYLPTVNSVTKKQYINVSDETEYGVTLSGTLAFVKWWAINPSYTFYQKNIKEDSNHSILADKRTAWRIGLSSQFILPKDWVIFVEYNYNSPVITAQTKEERNYTFVTGFYKKINQKFNITAFTLNPTENRYIFSKTATNAGDIRQNSTGVVKYDWIFNIRLGYSFNIGKEGKKVDRQVESDSDAGGKKGIL